MTWPCETGRELRARGQRTKTRKRGFLTLFLPTMKRVVSLITQWAVEVLEHRNLAPAN